MNRKIGLPTHLALAGAAMMALGALFTWTGNGNDDLWDNHDNWDHPGGCLSCWPDDDTDDAKIPTSATPWTVDLVEETIDDLTIEANTTFGDGGTDAVLTVESVTINGPAIVTATEGIKIVADAGP